MNTEPTLQQSPSRVVWAWAAAGLIGPGIIWGAVVWAPEQKLPLGEVVGVLYPTWLFCWLVMGLKSNILGNAIFTLSVVGNVLVFAAVGWVFSRLRRWNWAAQWGVTGLVYAAAYVAVTFIAYHL